MIYLYISPSCQSCRKTIKWFDEHKIPYRLFNIISEKLTKEDVFRMLKNTENGFDDIISTRSKPYQDYNLDMDSMKTSELVEFIIEHPTILKRPIIVSSDIVEIGYNADDIRAFIPPHMRTFKDMLNCEICDDDKSNCAYHNDPAILAKELKGTFENNK
ncbi:MAG: Spx/MgsR family RNA polymerase-binding regulatory protein [Gammaproteobacteria bacterium]|nr:Spx/MgsR family RNA polymerase-binding regulatory protein [Gammaproteobacteria bacterium]